MNVRAALRKIADNDDTISEADDLEQQYEMYRKTFEALEDISADDENEGIAVVTDWIIEQIDTTGKRPESRAVRQRGAQFCRHNDYTIPNDSWLGR